MGVTSHAEHRADTTLFSWTKKKNWCALSNVEHHKFDPINFVALLNKLAAGAFKQIAVIELYFVISMARMNFNVLESDLNFEKSVVQVAASNCNESETFQNCRTKVTFTTVGYS